MSVLKETQIIEKLLGVIGKSDSWEVKTNVARNPLAPEKLLRILQHQRKLEGV